MLNKAFIYSVISLCSMVSANDQDLANLSLEELLNVKISIANMSEQTTSEASSSVTVYTREEIRRMGISSLEELLNYVPGVQTGRTQHDGLSETPIFRGRAGQSGGSSSVLLLLDGRRMNNHVTGAAFSQPLNNLDWIKQVEIIRGPGSTLYGANAFNGVINLVTDIKQAEVVARVGELGLSEVSIQYKAQLDELEFEFYLHHYQDDGEDYPAFYQFLGSNDDTQDPKSRETVALNLNYKDWYYNGYYSVAVADDFVQGSAIGNGINQSDEQLINHHVSYKGLGSSDWKFEIYADYVQGISDFFIRIMPADIAAQIWWTDASEIDAIGGNHLEWNYKQTGISGHYQWVEQHSLTYGFEYRDEWVDVNPFHGNWIDQQMVSSQGSIVLPCDCISSGFWLPGLRADFLLESHREVSNAWLQDQWTVNDSLNVTLGMRYDHYNDFGGNASLRTAVVYRQNEDTLFKFLYGEAFRAPTFSETRAFVSSNLIGNADLQPETIQTIDLVWQQSFGNSNLVLTWSNSEIDDEIRLILFEDELQPGVLAFQPQNTGKSRLENWELEFNSSLTESLLVRAGYTYHDQFIKQGAAQQLAFLSINYSGDHWNANLNGFYHDKVLSRKTDGINTMKDIYLDDFWRFNLSLNYQINNDLTLMARVENLFDEDYKTFTTTDGGLEYGLPTRGRLLSIGANWIF